MKENEIENSKTKRGKENINDNWKEGLIICSCWARTTSRRQHADHMHPPDR